LHARSIISYTLFAAAAAAAALDFYDFLIKLMFLDVSRSRLIRLETTLTRTLRFAKRSFATFVWCSCVFLPTIIPFLSLSYMALIPEGVTREKNIVQPNILRLHLSTLEGIPSLVRLFLFLSIHLASNLCQLYEWVLLLSFFLPLAAMYAG
jgi:hypothetical protein